jgi:hypothetical protein
MFYINKNAQAYCEIGLNVYMSHYAVIGLNPNDLDISIDANKEFYWTEAGLLNKSCCLAAAFRVTKFVRISAITLVTLCCATFSQT